MERIPKEKLEAPKIKSGMPVELERALDNESAALKVGSPEKEEKKPSWPQKARAVLLGITILASAMAGTAKEAKAGEGFHFGQRAAQSAQQAIDQGINDFFRAGQEKRQRNQRMEEEAIRQRQNMQAEEVRRKQNMESDAVRTKLQLDEQRVRNFNDEIRAAKTDDEVAFIKRKYGMTGR
ncbi:MAG: hypothetical protein Q8L09_01195 [Candidatus Moranbacteria bacterium]|nr:hypothetical protein [Candidatus Moranbacteria bacterium]